MTEAQHAREALQAARDCIMIDRTALADAHFDHGLGRVDDEGQAGLDEYDAALRKIDDALAAIAAQQAAQPVALTERECETCLGTGTIDERLGGYSFSNPAATCPDCDGKGWWTPRTAASPVAPAPSEQDARDAARYRPAPRGAPYLPVPATAQPARAEPAGYVDCGECPCTSTGCRGKCFKASLAARPAQGEGR